MLILAQSAGKILSTGGVTTLIGLGMTFIVLGLLILIIMGLDYLFKKFSTITFKKSKNAPEVIDVREEKFDSAITVGSAIDENTEQAILQAVTMFSQYDDKDKKPHNNIKIKSIVEIE